MSQPTDIQVIFPYSQKPWASGWLSASTFHCHHCHYFWPTHHPHRNRPDISTSRFFKAFYLFIPTWGYPCLYIRTWHKLSETLIPNNVFWPLLLIFLVQLSWVFHSHNYLVPLERISVHSTISPLCPHFPPNPAQTLCFLTELIPLCTPSILLPFSSSVVSPCKTPSQVKSCLSPTEQLDMAREKHTIMLRFFKFCNPKSLRNIKHSLKILLYFSAQYFSPLCLSNTFLTLFLTR